MTGGVLKHSYTVTCSSAFRDRVETLAQQRSVNVGDLARSILLVAPSKIVDDWPDPGEPENGDRETVLLKTGPAAGRPWRRKPRLQVRMPPGHEISFIRKALSLALALDAGDVVVAVTNPRAIKVTPPPPPPPPLPDVTDEVERLRAIISVLAFEPLADGVHTRDQALHVLGFPPGAAPDSKTIRAKFRMLATIHHPDNALGSHQRMSQLNEAVHLLRGR